MAQNQDLDFWGLSIHHGAKTNPFKGKHLYRYLPVHIQSHFIVYRKRFVQSPELQAYWNEMPMIESYTDSVQRYEAVFTKQFEDRGFKWDVYVKTDDLKEFTDYRCWFARYVCCGTKSAPCSNGAALCMPWKRISTTPPGSLCGNCMNIAG